jgi:hypothetical protein
MLFSEFIESCPSNQRVDVINLWQWSKSGNYKQINQKDIFINCSNNSCQGKRFFRYYTSVGSIEKFDFATIINVQYECKNCGKEFKSFSLVARPMASPEGSGSVIKIGEWPPFEIEVSPNLLELLRTDKNLFQKGLEAELKNLGIGAFTYYRRVVENKKDELIDEIIQVAKKVDEGSEVIDSLVKAKETFQFSRAIKDIKPAIPIVLLINGENPLLLLHSALSTGIHGMTDEECLEIAKDVRRVLTALTERIARALEKDEELKDSVLRLKKIKAEKKNARQDTSKSKSKNSPPESSE